MLFQKGLYPTLDIEHTDFSNFLSSFFFFQKLPFCFPDFFSGLIILLFGFLFVCFSANGMLLD